MHSLDEGNRVFVTPSLDISLAEVNVRIEAPARVRSVLDATLLVVPRFEKHIAPDFTITVEVTDEAWKIHGLNESVKLLAAQSALPQVGGAVVTSVVRDVAATRNLTTMRATVISRFGRAIALVGDDWESAVTLATHLHGRGWSYIGSDNALLDPSSLAVFPIQKSLYVNSSAVVNLPQNYRRAVEASPWYVTPQGISFYAVDPRASGNGQTWAAASILCGVVCVDGAITERPSLETLDTVALRGERFARFGIDWSIVPAMDLKLGPFSDTCDIIEHWFGSPQ